MGPVISISCMVFTHTCSASSGIACPQKGHVFALCSIVLSGEVFLSRECPACPGCPPGFLPDGFRSEFVCWIICFAMDCFVGGMLELVLSFSTGASFFSLASSSLVWASSAFRLRFYTTSFVLLQFRCATSLLVAESSSFIAVISANKDFTASKGSVSAPKSLYVMVQI